MKTNKNIKRVRAMAKSMGIISYVDRAINEGDQLSVINNRLWVAHKQTPDPTHLEFSEKSLGYWID